jgi:hypothetical protein
LLIVPYDRDAIELPDFSDAILGTAVVRALERVVGAG